MSALRTCNSFLEEPVSDGNAIPTYKFVTFVNHIPIVNDTAEHAIRKTVDYANFGPKLEQGI